MADIFDVVDRELQEQKQVNLLRKFAPHLIAAGAFVLVLVLVLTVSGERRQEHRGREAALYLQAVDLLGNGEDLLAEVDALDQQIDLYDQVGMTTQAEQLRERQAEYRAIALDLDKSSTRALRAMPDSEDGPQHLATAQDTLRDRLAEPGSPLARDPAIATIIGQLSLSADDTASDGLATDDSGRNNQAGEQTSASAAAIVDQLVAAEHPIYKRAVGEAILQTLAETGREVYRLTARLRLVDLGVDNGADFRDTGNALGAAAADVSDPFYSDSALLKAVYARIDHISYAQAQSQLYPLTNSAQSPYRFLARELLAAKAVEAGDYAKAQQLYTQLAGDLQLPQSLAQRVQAGAVLAASLTAPYTTTFAAPAPASPMDATQAASGDFAAEALGLSSSQPDSLTTDGPPPTTPANAGAQETP